MSNATWKRYLPLVVVGIVSSLITSVVVVSYVFPNRKGDAAAVAASAAATVGQSPAAAVIPASAPLLTSAPIASLPSLADVAAAVAPTVVRIDITKAAAQRSSSQRQSESGNQLFAPFLDDFLNGLQRSEPESGSGSGFIISPDGHIVTNYHVVEGADKIQVTLTDGKKADAKVIGSHKEFDIAVIKIDAHGLPVAHLGSSQGLRPGDWVVAIGNPYGFDHTVTAGIVSALGRQLPNGDGTVLATGDLIQTDAAINAGNSGGPLINIDGKVIGINTAIMPYAQGIGFAIAIDSIKDVVSDLVAYGKIMRPWIGVWYQQLNEELAQQLKLPDSNGVLITDVVAGSPAEKAGIRREDVIREVNGKKVTPEMSLAEEVRKMKIGDRLLMWVWRGNQKLYITVQLGETPASSPES